MSEEELKALCEKLKGYPFPSVPAAVAQELAADCLRLVAEGEDYAAKEALRRDNLKAAVDRAEALLAERDLLRSRLQEQEAAMCAVWNDVAGDVGGEPHLISAGALYRVRKALGVSDGGPFAAALSEGNPS